MSMMTDPAEPEPGQGWRAGAACGGTDLVLWFGPPEPDEPGGYREAADQREWRERRAVQICDSCPVRRPCLAEELRRPMTHQWGVRGGMSDRDRRKLLRLLATADGAAPTLRAMS